MKRNFRMQDLLTHSYDVSLVIAKLVGKKNSLGEVLAADANLYPRVFAYTDLPELDEFFESGYQTKYDRMCDRSIDSKKVKL